MDAFQCDKAGFDFYNSLNLNDLYIYKMALNVILSVD